MGSQKPPFHPWGSRLLSSPTHIGSSSFYLAPYVLSPHPLLRPLLGPTPTFDGGVDEDDTAHGR